MPKPAKGVVVCVNGLLGDLPQQIAVAVDSQLVEMLSRFSLRNGAQIRLLRLEAIADAFV
jgi:hypothetical protein